MASVPSTPAGSGNEGDLPRVFKSRDQLAATLLARFPQLDGDLSPIVGGRRQAERLLELMDPVRYGSTRNHLDGAVTHLSPYIRHGVLTLAEVRDAAFALLRQAGPDRREARNRGGKLITELGWRDYWQRLWRGFGDAIWADLEPLKTGHPASAYADHLPEDIAAARTGLACIDAFAIDLARVGWLHNHARMWLASYVVHWRRVSWQAGARWFLEHLLDGDPASNNLSWQWVASAFSVRPYIFNRANLERFSGGRYCSGCPRAGAGGASRPGGCPFESSYEDLQASLFARQAADHPGDQGRGPRRDTAVTAPGKGTPTASIPEAEGPRQDRFKAPILWIHEESLGPASSPLHRHPQQPAVFVLEPDPISLRPLGFVYECLLELPVTIRCGDESAEVLAFANRHGADGVVTSSAVNPRFAEIRSRIAAEIPLEVVEPEPFVALRESGERPLDLGRFSRYWRRAEPLVWDLW